MPVRGLPGSSPERTGGLQLDDVLAVAHALFDNAGSVRTAHRVDVVACPSVVPGVGSAVMTPLKALFCT